MGDTPLGDWRGLVLDTVMLPTGSYGVVPPIRLEPVQRVDNPAWIAFKNGRRGILIHEGFLNTQGKLRPTMGCIRLFPVDMLVLRSLLVPVKQIPVFIRELV